MKMSDQEQRRGIRIRQARLAIGKTQEELAELCGVTKGAISQWEITGSGYTVDSLVVLCKALSVDSEYILHGQAGNTDLRAGRGEDIPNMSNSLDAIPAKAPRKVPVIDVSSIGGDNFVLDNDAIQYADVATDDARAFVVRVDGNDMYPRFIAGEYALVEPRTPPDAEDDVLVRLASGETLLRRLASKRGGVRLSAFNTHEVINLNERDIVWMYYVAHAIPAKQVRSSESGSQKAVDDYLKVRGQGTVIDQTGAHHGVVVSNDRVKKRTQGDR